MRKNYKPLIIGILCALIVVMAVGFALLREQLTITGSSHIDSNWNIRITNIRVKTLNSSYPSGDNASSDVSGSTGCTTNTAPCDSTSANFDAKLITPGDSITYEVTVTNSGNLDGVVSSINLTPETGSNDPIQVTKSGLEQGDKIAKAGGTNTIDVTVTYNSSTTSQPATTTTNITLTLNYQQDLSNSQSGQGGNESGTGGSSTTAFDTTTGTGTIYRYYTRETSGQTQYLSINDNIQSYINDSNNSWEWSTDPSTFNSINYLKHDVDNFTITASYACIIADGTEHCMQGGKDSNNQSYYSANVGILQGVQSWFNTNNGSCSIDASGSSSNCNGAGFGIVYAGSNGDVISDAAGVSCSVNYDGSSYCYR